jgi:peptide/nickel transport system substrate-binding protein
MKARRITIAAAALSVLALVAACTATPNLKKGSEVAVAIDTAMTSYNPATSFGETLVNQQLSYATNTGFSYYDNQSRLVEDTSFGTMERVGSSPLSVRYTIRRGVKWSDGVQVGRADLLLAWAAESGALNTAGFDPRKYFAKDKTFRSDFPRSAVWFDSRATSGAKFVTATPKAGASGRSVTLVYDQFASDWKTAFQVGLPAHVVAEKAFGITSPTKADAALVTAITSGDTVRLAKVSRVWNSAFNLRKGAIDPALLVGDGPYSISSVAKDGTVTMTVNKKYSGSRQPHVQTIVARVLPRTPGQVSALDAGAVDVITPRATSAAVRSLINVRKITLASGYDASFEQLSLQFAHSKNGVFVDPRVRRAFLKTVPRKRIVSLAVGGIQEEPVARSSFLLFPGSTAYDNDIASNGSRAYDSVDVSGARQLLKAAGQPHPVVCVLFDPTNAVRTAEYKLIRTSAALAGIRVTDCSTPNWLTMLGKRGAYDAALYGWRSTTDPVGSAVPRLHSGVSTENYSFYSSAVADKLLDALAAAPDDAEQNELLATLDKQLFTDAYGLPLYQQPALTAFRTSVTGIQRSPFAPGVFWNLWDWRSTR